MHKRIVTLTMVILLVASLNLLFIEQTKAGNFHTVYVDDNYSITTHGFGEFRFNKIQDGIDAVIENGTVQVYNGTYYENLVVNKTIDLLGEDRAITIIDGNESGDVITISANWVNLSGFTIQNSGSDADKRGIRIGSNYNTIQDNTITANGIGVLIIKAGNNTITGNTVISNARDGVWLSTSRDNDIFDNDITDNNRYGIFIYHSPNTQITSNNNISLNKKTGISVTQSNGTVISNNRISNSIDENGIALASSHFIQILSNTIEGNKASGIRVMSSNEIILSENTINDNQLSGVTLQSADINSVSDNTITGNHEGIYLVGSCDNNIITDNTVEGNDYLGIMLENACSNNTISGNLIQLNNYNGIYLQNACNDNTISNNDINSNAQYGIDINASHNNKIISNNTIQHNFYGIHLVLSDYSEIANTIIHENNYGIALASADYTTVNANIISSHHRWGVQLFQSSDNNVFYHNNFIDNSFHVLDCDCLGNTWYYEPLFAGNYWDDYNGTDADGDGIGDTPYELVNGFDQDPYPLMSSYGDTAGLRISAPSTVNENGSFQVNVTDLYGVAIPSAAVNFSGTISYTDTRGVADLQAPLVEVDTEMLISASKTGYLPDTEWIMVLNIDTSSELQLEISIPSTVIEGEEFTVAITANDLLLKDALVLFAEEEYYTDDTGTVLLIAPQVTKDTAYSITTTKTGYQSATQTLTVLNYEPSLQEGWIAGTITDSSGSIISDAQVSIRITEDTTRIIFSDEQGYSLRVPVGTYTVEASKQGYMTYTEYDISVEKNVTTPVNIILEKSITYTPQTTGGEQRDVIEAAIDAGVIAEKISGEIDVEPEIYDIILYDPELTIEEVIIEENKISFTTKGEGLPGTIIALRLFNQGEIADVQVEFDNTTAEQVSLIDLLNTNDNTSTASYAWVETQDDAGTVAYCFIRIPYHSEHHISIYTLLPEEMIHITIITIAFALLLLGAATFGMFKKGKED